MAASPGGGAPKVPKVFTERAKLAAAQAQVALDQLKARLADNTARAKGEIASRQAQLRANQSQHSFLADRMDSALQARADVAAAQSQQAQEEPVGPPNINVVPLPSASRPSDSLAGAGGPNINDILTAPGAVQGGAGIKAATGGMGRAVPPTITSQQTTTGQQAYQRPSGDLTVLPTSETQTRTS